MPYQVKRYHDISCGHRVVGHEGKCRNLHGHNYRVHFVCQADMAPVQLGEASYDPKIASELDSVGRVIDFSEVKARLCMWLEDNWDHKMLIWWHDPSAAELREIDPTVVILPFNPTAENLAQYLVEKIGPAQLEGTGIRLVYCEIEETRKCSASFSVY